MAKNPYQVLGVAQSASDADIRSAFRALAKKYHPDRNPDDKKAEERFKEVSAAFDILGDPDKRRKFDRGEIDAEGRQRAYGPQPGGPRGGPGRAGAGPGGGFGGYNTASGPGGGASFEDLGDIFSDIFGKGRSTQARGRDLRYRLEVDFLDAARGAKKRVTMPDGRKLEISIPAGLDDGQTLRLRGQGEPGLGGGPAGDVYVEAKIIDHPDFRRDGRDIHVETAIGLKTAVLGGKITTPTIDGEVTVTVPKNSSSGTILRLKGRGLPDPKGEKTGDQYVTLKIVLPEGGDPVLEAFVKSWNGGEQDAKRQNFANA